jgi:hypothetical protein
MLFKHFHFALLLQELLLLLPYLPHRRGVWYKRLCVNYDHEKLPRAALRAAYRGINDPLVNVRTMLVQLAILAGCYTCLVCLK